MQLPNSLFDRLGLADRSLRQRRLQLLLLLAPAGKQRPPRSPPSCTTSATIIVVLTPLLAPMRSPSEMDIAMPVMDGLETCRQLRERPGTQDIRIIMMTAYDTRDRLEESIVAGADDFLGKPVNLAEMQIRIGSMLKVKDMADEMARLEAYIKSLDELRAQAAESKAAL